VPDQSDPFRVFPKVNALDHPIGGLNRPKTKEFFMKPVSLLMILFCLVLGACGKDNKSGKNNRYGNYGFNQLGAYGGYNGTNIAYNGFNLRQVVNENPCVNGAPPQSRSVGAIQAPVNTVIAPGDVYVGVTSFGDVAAIGGTPQGPVMQYFICPRQMQGQPQGLPSNISLFPYTNCGFKQMNASLRLADGSVANFRMMDYGNSMGTKFSYCR
jgi:hypothetical protein